MSELKNLIQLDNGAYLGVGHYAGNNFSPAAWIFRTDANGVLNMKNSTIDKNISVYPNPTKDILYINLPHLHSLETISIYNALGQLVFSKPISNEPHQSICTRELKKGIYIIKCSPSNEKLATCKFIKN